MATEDKNNSLMLSQNTIYIEGCSIDFNSEPGISYRANLSSALSESPCSIFTLPLI